MNKKKGLLIKNIFMQNTFNLGVNGNLKKNVQSPFFRTLNVLK